MTSSTCWNSGIPYSIRLDLHHFDEYAYSLTSGAAGFTRQLDCGWRHWRHPGHQTCDVTHISRLEFCLIFGNVNQLCKASKWHICLFEHTWSVAQSSPWQECKMKKSRNLTLQLTLCQHSVCPKAVTFEINLYLHPKSFFSEHIVSINFIITRTLFNVHSITKTNYSSTLGCAQLYFVYLAVFTLIRRPRFKNLFSYQ